MICFTESCGTFQLWMVVKSVITFGIPSKFIAIELIVIELIDNFRQSIPLKHFYEMKPI